jgi:hypothetical protein
MRRRQLLRLAALALIPEGLLDPRFAPIRAGTVTARRVSSRVRPGESGWPSAAHWDGLNRDVGGRLLQPASPFAYCAVEPAGAPCNEALKHIQNPYYIGDEVGLTQTSGWLDAWTSQTSVYAVAARSTADVVAAVNFAREHKLRIVVKGGGHSYHGTSCAPDSLLV